MDEKMNDQAEELKKIFAEIEQHQGAEDSLSVAPKVKKVSVESPEPQTIDVLNLPPRAVYHNNYRKRARLKMSRPLVRLMITIFCFVSVIVSGYYFYGEELIAILKKI